MLDSRVQMISNGFILPDDTYVFGLFNWRVHTIISRMTLPSMHLPLFYCSFSFTLPINTSILPLVSCTTNTLKPFWYIQPSVFTHIIYMETSKRFIASLVISLLLLHLVEADKMVKFHFGVISFFYVTNFIFNATYQLNQIITWVAGEHRCSTWLFLSANG